MSKQNIPLYLSIQEYFEEEEFPFSEIRGIPKLSDDQKELISQRAMLEKTQVYIGEGVTDEEIKQQFALKLKETYQTILDEEKQKLREVVALLQVKNEKLSEQLFDGQDFNYSEELIKYRQDRESSKLSSLSPKEVIEINEALVKTRAELKKAELVLEYKTDYATKLQDSIDEEKKEIFKGKEPKLPVLFSGKLEHLNSVIVPERVESKDFTLTPSNYLKEKGIPYTPIIKGMDVVPSFNDFIDVEPVEVVLDEEIAQLIERIDKLIEKVDKIIDKMEIFRAENDIPREKENKEIEEALNGTTVKEVSIDDVDMASSAKTDKKAEEKAEKENEKQNNKQIEILALPNPDSQQKKKKSSNKNKM